MPAPIIEQQAMERERAQLSDQLATHQSELDRANSTPRLLSTGDDGRSSRGKFGEFKSGWLRLKLGWLEPRTRAGNKIPDGAASRGRPFPVR
jgi:hypothetical protein